MARRAHLLPPVPRVTFNQLERMIETMLLYKHESKRCRMFKNEGNPAHRGIHRGPPISLHVRITSATKSQPAVALWIQMRKQSTFINSCVAPASCSVRSARRIPMLCGLIGFGISRWNTVVKNVEYCDYEQHGTGNKMSAFEDLVCWSAPSHKYLPLYGCVLSWQLMQYFQLDPSA